LSRDNEKLEDLRYVVEKLIEEKKLQIEKEEATVKQPLSDWFVGFLRGMRTGYEVILFLIDRVKAQQ